MAGNFLHLLVVLLSISSLLCLNAVPVTRSRSLTRDYQGHGASKTTLLAKIVKDLETNTVIRRMDVELNDYPGSGANNRHTPTKPPS